MRQRGAFQVLAKRAGGVTIACFTQLGGSAAPPLKLLKATIGANQAFGDGRGSPTSELWYHFLPFFSLLLPPPHFMYITYRLFLNEPPTNGGITLPLANATLPVASLLSGAAGAREIDFLGAVHRNDALVILIIICITALGN